MIMLQRKLKCKFIGEQKYLPDNFPPNQFVPVVGYEIRKRNIQRQGSDEVLTVEDVYYQVIDNKGKLIPVASFNMQTMIDDGDEKAVMAIAQNTGEIASMIKSSMYEGEIVVRTNPQLE